MKTSLRLLGTAFLLVAFATSAAVFAQAKDEKKPAADKPAVKPAEPAKPAAQPATEKPAAAKPADKPAADKPAAAGAAKAPAQPSPEEIAKMMAMGAPGEFHAKLKPLAGKWTYTTKWRMGADQPWEESTGKAEYKWILGGRILVQEAKNNPDAEKDKMMGGPFEGFGLTAYDNLAKKYYNVWGDNMGTGIMTSTGTCDGSGKTFTYMSDAYICPMSGDKKTSKSVLKIVGDDKVVYEMYDTGPDGKEFVNLEVSYARSK